MKASVKAAYLASCIIWLSLFAEISPSPTNTKNGVPSLLVFLPLFIFFEFKNLSTSDLGVFTNTAPPEDEGFKSGFSSDKVELIKIKIQIIR